MLDLDHISIIQIITDIEEHQPLNAKYINVDVELIRQPKGPNWPTVPPSPQFGQVVQLFFDVKNDVFARITGPSNDDYDNDVCDN